MVRLIRHRRLPLLVAAFVLLIVLAAGGAMVFIITHAHSEQAGDDGIPFEHSLAAMGLVATPAPGQKSGPFTVDRVVVDGEHTYIAYHVSVPWHARSIPSIEFRITAIPGGWLNTGGGTGCTQAHGLLPDWFPYHPAVMAHCINMQGSVAPTAHAVLLQPMIFGQPGLAFPAIRVPLNLHALRHRRNVALHGSVTVRGITISLTQVYRWPVGTYLEGMVAGPPNSVPAVLYTFVNGRKVQNIGTGDCNNVCPLAWALPAEAHGIRLTLDIPQVLISQGVPVIGPWLVTFTMP